ncbi:unnamed protein product, partial [Phaeothamnion confervicola]
VSAFLCNVFRQAIVALCDKLVAAKKLSKDMSRKAVHIAAGCLLLFWPLFSTEHWTWRLNILVPALYIPILLMKGLGGAAADDPDVRAMTRSGDPKELLRGPLYFATVAVAIGLFLFRQDAGYLVMAPLTFGDGIAPLVGAAFPRCGRYRTFGRPKTAAGSAAVFVFGMLGSAAFQAAGWLSAALDWPVVTAAMLLATVVEALSPSDLDNIFIPTAVLFVLWVA